MLCPIVTDCLGFEFAPYLNVILVMIACSTVGVYSFSHFVATTTKL